MPCKSKRDKRLWEEAKKQVKDASLRRKKSKEGAIEDPEAYQMSIYRRMKERKGGEKAPKKEMPLAASKEPITFAIRLHNLQKEKKIERDINKTVDPLKKGHLQFVLNILKRTNKKEKDNE